MGNMTDEIVLGQMPLAEINFVGQLLMFEI